MPLATMSGLMRPSSVGPQPLKVDMTTSPGSVQPPMRSSTAPTVRMFLAHACWPIESYPLAPPSGSRASVLHCQPPPIQAQWPPTRSSLRSLPADLQIR